MAREKNRKPETGYALLIIMKKQLGQIHNFDVLINK
jgi:hypothetical protein